MSDEHDFELNIESWPNCLRAAYTSTEKMTHRLNLQIAADLIADLRASLTAKDAENERLRHLEGTDDHPEHRCERCNGRNIVWYAESPLWNAVAGDASILCPICFVNAAIKSGVDPTAWRIAPEDDGDECDSLRVQLHESRDEIERLTRERDDMAADLERLAVEHGKLRTEFDSQCHRTAAQHARAESAESTVERLTRERHRDERLSEQEIEERDRANDALSKAHIALGGDGEWVTKIGASADRPPNSGDLCADVPALAADVMARAESAESTVASLRRELEDKDAVIEKLPLLADGVRASLGMKVYCEPLDGSIFDGFIECIRYDGAVIVVETLGKISGFDSRANELYSSDTAAVEAWIRKNPSFDIGSIPDKYRHLALASTQESHDE